MHGWWKVGTFSFSLLGPIFFFFFLLIFWEIQWHPFDNYSIRKMTKPPLVLSKIIIVIRIYFSTNFRHWHSVNMHGAVKSDTDKSLNLNNQEKIVINKENLCIFKWKMIYGNFFIRLSNGIISTTFGLYLISINIYSFEK